MQLFIVVHYSLLSFLVFGLVCNTRLLDSHFAK